MMETLTGKIAKNSNQAAAVCLPVNASNFSLINNISKPVELFNVNTSRVFNNPTSPTLNKTHAKRQRIVDSSEQSEEPVTLDTSMQK